MKASFVYALLLLVIGMIGYGLLDWPYGIVSAGSGVVLALVLTVIGLIDSSPVRANPGEEEITSFLAARRQLVWLMVSLMVTGVLFLLSAGPVYLTLVSPWDFLGALVCLLAALVIFSFCGSSLMWALADLGWWFVKPDENTAAMVEIGGVCHKIVMAVTDPELRPHYERLAAWRNWQLGREVYALLPVGVGIHFLGFTAWPWKIKLRQPWYENAGDVNLPTKQPFRYLPLYQRTWDLMPVSRAGVPQPGGVVPVSGDAHAVEVETDLYCRVWTFDPYLAVYGSTFPAETAVSSICVTLRQVIQSLSFFTRGPKAKGADPAAKGGNDQELEEELEITPGIQASIYRQLVLELGICQLAEPAD